MGWVKEITDLFSALKFYHVIREDQQGLFFRNGLSIPVKENIGGADLEKIVNEEAETLRLLGFKGLIYPFFKPDLPEGYTFGRTGRPRHGSRNKKDRVLKPGPYFSNPFTDKIVMDSGPNQDKVDDAGTICIMTDDEPSKNLLISCTLNYRVMDFYRAYTAVDDYVESLKDNALSILAKNSMGTKADYWRKRENVEKTEEKVLDELRKIATEKWGLKITKFYITDIGQTSLTRIEHTGNQPFILKDTVQHSKISELSE